MEIRSVPLQDTRHLDDALLDAEGKLKVVSSEVYVRFGHALVVQWAVKHGFYLLPTTELVAYLKHYIGGRSAVEIGCGHGALGRALGIPTTDAKIQERPDVQAYYAALGQPIVKYPNDVEKLEAFEAVAKYRPQVVIGAWITQWGHRGAACMYGVAEDALLANTKIEEYIVIGAESVHGTKSIRQWPHVVRKFPWIWSRSFKKDDRIFFWKKAL